MDNWLWKWVWRIALLVGIGAGIVTITAHIKSGNVPMFVIYCLLGTCIVLGTIGLVMDFKPWTWGLRRNTKPPAFITRQFFVARWKVGSGPAWCNTFFAQLSDDGSAIRTQDDKPTVYGTWQFTEGRAVIKWPDHWRDELNTTALGLVKVAFHEDQYNNSDIAIKLP